MLLPETTRTPEGFTVEGASPELLTDLLDAYAFELRSRSRRIYDLMMPGLSAAEIQDSFGAIGLVPPAEAVVWWQWRNGYRAMIGHGMRHAQLTLADATALYRGRSLGTAEDQWNPDWILVAGEANSGDAICCRPSDKPPLVRSVSTFRWARRTTKTGCTRSSRCAHRLRGDSWPFSKGGTSTNPSPVSGAGTTPDTRSNGNSPT